MDNLLIRNAQLQEMPYIIDLAAREGWNPGLNDAEFYFIADTSGFIIALLNGQLVGCISAVSYGDNFGFIGFHIICEELRNRNFENHLLRAVLQKLGNRNIALNCFEYQLDYYQYFGFKPAYKILRYEGVVNGEYKLHDNVISPFLKKYDLLYDYEKKFFPADRKYFIYQWMNQPGSMVLGKFINNEYKGFGVFLPCLNGHKIAPLIGDDINTADELLCSLLYHLKQGTRYFIDIPETNNAAIELAERYDMKPLYSTFRMYSQGKPDDGLNNIYGFTSFELG